MDYIPKVGDKVRVRASKSEFEGQIAEVVSIQECCGIKNTVIVDGLLASGSIVTKGIPLHGPCLGERGQYEPIYAVEAVANCEESWVSYIKRR